MHFIPLFFHFNTMIVSTNNFTSLFCDYLMEYYTSRRSIFFFLQDIQMVELVLALPIFIGIHALRQKKRYGLPMWPVLGMLPSSAIALRGNMYDWISNLIYERNGTFTFKGPWFSSLNCVVIADPRNLEHLLKMKFVNFPKGQYFQDTVCDLLRDGIFNKDDETWQMQRKMASIEFHSAKFRQLTTVSLVELVHFRLLPVLENAMNNTNSIDLQDILLRLTFDSVCMIAFGVDPGCLILGLPNIPFAKAFKDATEVTMVCFVMTMCVRKAMRYICLGTENKLRMSVKGIDEFAEQVIRIRKNELCDDDKQRSNALTVFMRLKDENGKPFLDKFLRDICVNFILAGRDTSSVALNWFFWLLQKHHQVKHEILCEINKIVKERNVKTQNTP